MLKSLHEVLQRSLADPDALSQHPAALGVRFRLLFLGLKHARYLQVCLLVIGKGLCYIMMKCSTLPQAYSINMRTWLPMTPVVLCHCAIADTAMLPCKFNCGRRLAGGTQQLCCMRVCWCQRSYGSATLWDTSGAGVLKKLGESDISPFLFSPSHPTCQ